MQLVNLGDVYRLNIKAINIQTARVAAAYVGLAGKNQARGCECEPRVANKPIDFQIPNMQVDFFFDTL